MVIKLTPEWRSKIIWITIALIIVGGVGYFIVTFILKINSIVENNKKVRSEQILTSQEITKGFNLVGSDYFYILIDPYTHCHYIVDIKREVITPRLWANGKQICEEELKN